MTMPRASTCILLLFLLTTGMPSAWAQPSLSTFPSYRADRASTIQLSLWNTGSSPGTIYGVGLGLPTLKARRVHGLAAGLLGVNAEQSIYGAALGGFGVGAEKHIYGLSISGFGIGADQNIAGLTLAGFGIGAGNVSGITVAGFGIGASHQINGLTVAGLGTGAYALNGLTVTGLAVGATHITGVVAAPAYVHVQPGGRLTGLSVSAFNRIEGRQYGLTIGIFNYAEHLHGLQLGLLNYAGNNSLLFQLLPVLNVHLP